MQVRPKTDFKAIKLYLERGWLDVKVQHLPPFSLYNEDSLSVCWDNFDFCTQIRLWFIFLTLLNYDFFLEKSHVSFKVLGKH